jgi:hypothetical protein
MPYSGLLRIEQGRMPARMHLVLGNNIRVSVRVADFDHYQAIAQQRLEAFAANPSSGSNPDASARCNASSQLDPRSASSVSMPPSTTLSICNDTSSHGPRRGPSEPKRRRIGKMPSQRHKPDLPPPGLSIVAVTRATRPQSRAGFFEGSRQVRVRA